jgi:hypothetical protein
MAVEMPLVLLVVVMGLPAWRRIPPAHLLLQQQEL